MSVWSCPNTPPCPHPGLRHDIYEPGDPYPTCCVEGCRCGHPGEAVLRRSWGAVRVVRADPVIRVSVELLDQLAGTPHYDPATETLVLDTAGKWRYRYLRPDPSDAKVAIFGREAPAGVSHIPGMAATPARGVAVNDHEGAGADDRR